jgi:1-aminocyclopropane-1-carboxylate deaminase
MYLQNLKWALQIAVLVIKAVNSFLKSSSSFSDVSLNTDKQIRLTPLQKLADAVYDKKKISVYLKREDLCHEIISGNKWHKLRLNLLEAKRLGRKQVLSFGGAWSNHLHALAYACQQEHLKCIAVIRGEELQNKPLNPMLSDAESFGAQLVFISRNEYQRKEEKTYLNTLQNEVGPAYIIPEGGANDLGVVGSKHFALECLAQFHNELTVYPTHIVLACGSGTMTAGFINALEELDCDFPIELIAYVAAKDANMQQKINQLSGLAYKNCSENISGKLKQVFTLKDMSGKGFSRTDAEQYGFMLSLQDKLQIPLDPVYMGKLFYHLSIDIEHDDFPEGSRILVIHSGGAQGARSLIV